MSQVTLNVPDISCGHCKMSIESAVAELSHVAAVEVDIPGRTVDISFDGDETALESIVNAIEDQGYEVAR